MHVDYPQSVSNHCPGGTDRYPTEKPADCAPTLPFTVHLRAEGGQESTELRVGPTPPGDLDHDMGVELIPNQANEHIPQDGYGDKVELGPPPLNPQDNLTQHPPDATIRTVGQCTGRGSTKDQQPGQHLKHAEEGANLQHSKPALMEGLEDMEIDDPPSEADHQLVDGAMPQETTTNAYSQQKSQLQEPIPERHGPSPPPNYSDANLEGNNPHLSGDILDTSANESQTRKTELTEQQTALRVDEGTSKRKEDESASTAPADSDKPPLAAPPPLKQIKLSIRHSDPCATSQLDKQLPLQPVRAKSAEPSNPILPRQGRP